MRLFSARLIVSLIVGVTVVSLCSSSYQVLMLKRGLRHDLEHRAEVLAESLSGSVERDIDHEAQPALDRLVQRFANREHLVGVAVYDANAKLIAVTASLQPVMDTPPAIVLQAIRSNQGSGSFIRLADKQTNVYALPLRRGDAVIGSLAVIHDASYIRSECLRIWRETFLSALAHVVIIVFITLLIVRWSVARPVTKLTQWLKALRTGRPTTHRVRVPDLELFQPLVREVATLTESLNVARAAAQAEARLRETSESLWTADRLAVHLRDRLEDGRLFVVSNREPYMHTRQGGSIEVQVPPSGLVTAIEPVLRACQGTWVAHGSGDADRENVDRHDRLPVPPDDPSYVLRRVWLSKEEEDGYYYGFSNEGMWPLCHIAHTRPIFRPDDWKQYQAVNQKFADSLLEEMEGAARPLVLVQDYHFALVPRLIKQSRPDARVGIFWHIPWPNPEAFRICPWQEELVDGLLGADLIGFHIQAHCLNFLQTVDRVVESRISWEHSTVQRLEHLTSVQPYPISVEFSEPSEPPAQSSYEERARILESLGVEATFMGVGVDRMDYTKGILERLRAVEVFLEKYSRYRKVFTFVQIGAPTRSHIQRYHDLQAQVESEAERINWRFQTDRWKPIVLLNRQHSHQEIAPYYRAADLCLVTSLHDGMNLVAKEFVASRHDELGVLILSCFTGAARQLQDAIQVNPYDVDKTAEAIRMALEMDLEERRLRMQRMRRLVREQNVYRWAANLIGDLCEVRVERATLSSVKLRIATPAA